MNAHALKRITESWEKYNNVHFVRRMFGRLEAAAKKQAEPHVLHLNDEIVKMASERIQSFTMNEKAYWTKRIQWLDGIVLRCGTQCEKTKEHVDLFAGRNQ